jgi:hypothetical protein
VQPAGECHNTDTDRPGSGFIPPKLPGHKR